MGRNLGFIYNNNDQNMQEFGDDESVCSKSKLCGILLDDG